MKGAIVAVVVLTGYAWVSAGAAPFTALSYVLVAIPCVAFVLVFVLLGGLSRGRRGYYQRKAGNATISTVAPWIVLLTAAIVLEVVGLLLGGRSPSVPTLSTAVDHLLAHRWER